jgi:hypothetical protein
MIPLYAPFYSKETMKDYIRSLCNGNVKEGDIYVLLGMFEQTLLKGFSGIKDTISPHDPGDENVEPVYKKGWTKDNNNLIQERVARDDESNGDKRVNGTNDNE